MGTSIDIELGQRLAQAKARLAEISKTADDSGAQVSELTRWIAEVQARRDADAETALLDGGRKPDAKLSTELEALTLRLHASMARAKTAGGAALRQLAIVTAIEREITAGEYARLLADISTPGREIKALLDQLGEKVMAVRARIGLAHVSPCQLFDIGPDEWHRAGVYNETLTAVIRQEQALCQYDARRAREQWRVA